MRLRFFAMSAILLSISLVAGAATITFSGTTYGGDSGTTYTESGYNFGASSGTVFYNQLGNPGMNVEGSEAGGGGVLSIVSSTPGATFTLGGLDYAAYNSSGTGSQTMEVEGLLNGVVVGTSFYTLANTSNFIPAYGNWTTESAGGLAGVTVDQLEFALAAGTAPDDFQEAVDNVVLNAASTSTTPEPSSIALLGTGLLGFAGMIRRRLS